MNKIFNSATEAVHDINDGATILLSGFGLCGLPENLIQAVKAKGPRGLTLGSNNAGTSDFGITFLLEAGLVKKMISTYVGENKVFEQMFLSGETPSYGNVPGKFQGGDDIRQVEVRRGGAQGQHVGRGQGHGV